MERLLALLAPITATTRDIPAKQAAEILRLCQTAILHSGRPIEHLQPSLFLLDASPPPSRQSNPITALCHASIGLWLAILSRDAATNASPDEALLYAVQQHPTPVVLVAATRILGNPATAGIWNCAADCTASLLDLGKHHLEQSSALDAHLLTELARWMMSTAATTPIADLVGRAAVSALDTSTTRSAQCALLAIAAKHFTSLSAVIEATHAYPVARQWLLAHTISCSHANQLAVVQNSLDYALLNRHETAACAAAAIVAYHLALHVDGDDADWVQSWLRLDVVNAMDHETFSRWTSLVAVPITKQRPVSAHLLLPCLAKLHLHYAYSVSSAFGVPLPAEWHARGHCHADARVRLAALKCDPSGLDPVAWLAVEGQADRQVVSNTRDLSNFLPTLPWEALVLWLHSCAARVDQERALILLSSRLLLHPELSMLVLQAMDSPFESVRRRAAAVIHQYHVFGTLSQRTWIQRSFARLASPIPVARESAAFAIATLYPHLSESDIDSAELDALIGWALSFSKGDIDHAHGALALQYELRACWRPAHTKFAWSGTHLVAFIRSNVDAMAAHDLVGDDAEPLDSDMAEGRWRAAGTWRALALASSLAVAACAGAVNNDYLAVVHTSHCHALVTLSHAGVSQHLGKELDTLLHVHASRDSVLLDQCYQRAWAALAGASPTVRLDARGARGLWLLVRPSLVAAKNTALDLVLENAQPSVAVMHQLGLLCALFQDHKTRPFAPVLSSIRALEFAFSVLADPDVSASAPLRSASIRLVAAVGLHLLSSLSIAVAWQRWPTLQTLLLASLGATSPMAVRWAACLFLSHASTTNRASSSCILNADSLAALLQTLACCRVAYVRRMAAVALARSAYSLPQVAAFTRTWTDRVLNDPSSLQNEVHGVVLVLDEQGALDAKAAVPFLLMQPVCRMCPVVRAAADAVVARFYRVPDGDGEPVTSIDTLAPMVVFRNRLRELDLDALVQLVLADVSGGWVLADAVRRRVIAPSTPAEPLLVGCDRVVALVLIAREWQSRGESAQIPAHEEALQLLAARFNAEYAALRSTDPLVAWHPAVWIRSVQAWAAAKMLGHVVVEWHIDAISAVEGMFNLSQ